MIAFRGQKWSFHTVFYYPAAECQTVTNTW